MCGPSTQEGPPLGALWPGRRGEARGGAGPWRGDGQRLGAPSGQQREGRARRRGEEEEEEEERGSAREGGGAALQRGPEGRARSWRPVSAGLEPRSEGPRGPQRGRPRGPWAGKDSPAPGPRRRGFLAA
ncbi:unnamed protein product [Prorocentrum cordatum]|uniref:Uncharacterized protein n=1 Tax=Prorocentrum cordatum TaxID=2364126 RepID=A0ABN9QZX0_9DINO|nr:unnamed protein product [Polarella glacialis]